MATVYAIISTKNSSEYTDFAVDSFFKHTKLSTGDVLYVIDNDNTSMILDPRAMLINNDQPRGFAANINSIIKLANGLDVVILNNDIIFTSGWNEPLAGYTDVILLPSCNQTHQYISSDGSLELQSSVTLNEYNNNMPALIEIVQEHKNKVGRGFFEKLIMPFYAFKLPAKIYSKVGLFNEDYGDGGGEDVDYRVRALQAGFGVKYVKQSYLLHFQGKSTWNSNEGKQKTNERNVKYFQHFTNVWNKDMADTLLTGGDAQRVVQKYQLWNYVQENKFSDLIKQLLFLREGNSIVPLSNVSAPGLLKYVNELGDNLVGCELGVCLGYTLRYFLDKSTNIKKVYAVDAWEPYMDHWGMVTQEMVDRWKSYALNLLEPYADRIEILEMDSSTAATKIYEQELDYIFIDGDHSYDAVSSDLRSYWFKVKPGGIFAGHDWNLPDVNRAVNDFRQEYNINTEIKFTDNNVWFWYK